VLLVFSDPNCSPCTELLRRVAGWQRDLAAELTIAVVGERSLEENHARAQELGLCTVLVQREREVAEAYECLGTPSAVLIATDGTIASGVAQGPSRVAALAGEAVRRPFLVQRPPVAGGSVNGADRTAARIGDPVPEFALPTIDGAETSSRESWRPPRCCSGIPVAVSAGRCSAIQENGRNGARLAIRS